MIACVPGIFGHVFFFRNLVASWPDDWGLCALPSRYLDPDADARLLTLEDIAAENLTRLEKAGVSRVDAVAGYSFGGLVAYEMARLLASRGKPPALILFDAASEGEQFRGEAVCGSSLPVVRRAWRRIRYHANRMLYRHVLRHGRMIPTQRFNPALLANLDALEGYRPQPYAGGMLLIRATAEAPAAGVDPETMGWARLVRGPCTVRDVAATHLGMFHPPHVAEVAAMTIAYLRHHDEHRGHDGPAAPRLR